MAKRKISDAKIVGFVGWAIVIYAVLRYGYAYYDISSDASVRAYAFLVLIEGGFYLLIGVIVLFVAKRLARKAAAKQGEG